MAFHIVLGGLDNGDKDALDKLHNKGKTETSWIVPKGALVGDEVVIYIKQHGFYATAKVTSKPEPATDWQNRHRAKLSDLRLVTPPVSLDAIRTAMPKLRWTNYPMGMKTLSPDEEADVRRLTGRTATEVVPAPPTEEESLETLHALALKESRARAPVKQSKRNVRTRSFAVHRYVLRRANGVCEGCGSPAPFLKRNNTPYLEPHHIDMLAEDGPDHPSFVIAVCPTCHSRAHHAIDAESYNNTLRDKLSKIAVPAKPQTKKKS